MAAAREPLLNKDPSEAAISTRPVDTVVAPSNRIIALEVQEVVPSKAEPFCSVYMFFFFMGLFFSPLFLLCGMLGLYSNQPHERLAGRASVVATLVYTTLAVILITALACF